MAYEPLSQIVEKNYILIYFWMLQKMDNINIFFMQININQKYKLHMKLQTAL
jgi:hypothetical protein